MTSDIESFSRYLPTDQQAKKWGWRLMHAGRQNVPPHSEYPSKEHPLSYLFDTSGRRTLDEYQIVYITTGSGHFESRTQPKTEVRTGDAILLFPGEWHRYHPHSETGWSEYWIGFRGREADRIMAAFFSAKHPILKASHSDALIQHFDQILHWLQQPVAAKDQILASHVPLALAFLKSGALTESRSQSKDSALVIQAKATMLAKLATHTDLEALAQQLGVSYSRFRFAFKKQTGYAPREFENSIKLNRARDLLLRESKSVTETANALGYSTVYYFSRAFKKKFGQSPQQWFREQIR
jgi:AraC-like DNA-binding protein|tara:strand:+ start:847 stop:1734 length:888 start_codon:yes stop_codon:yes gene_type:complete